MSYNPHSPNNTDRQIDEAVTRASITYAWVDTTFPEDNQVKVQPVGEPHTFKANVAVTMDGSIAVPDASSDQELLAIVAKASERKPTVIGFTYDASKQQTPPDADSGERVIGHQLTDSSIYFQADGTVLIESDGGATVELRSDGTVVINNGSDGVITDVTTTEDADGHVTDVSVTRNNSILV